VSLIPTTLPLSYFQPPSSTPVSVTDGATPHAAVPPIPPGTGASELDSDERFLHQMGQNMQPSSAFTLLTAHTWTFSSLPRSDKFANAVTAQIRESLKSEGFTDLDISVSISTFIIPGTSSTIQRHVADISLMDSSFSSSTSPDSDLSAASRAGQHLVSTYGLSAHTAPLPITLRAAADVTTFSLHFSRGDTLLASATTHMRNNCPQAFLTDEDLPADATRVAVVIRLPDAIMRTPGALEQYKALLGRKFGGQHKAPAVAAIKNFRAGNRAYNGYTTFILYHQGPWGQCPDLTLVNGPDSTTWRKPGQGGLCANNPHDIQFWAMWYAAGAYMLTLMRLVVNTPLVASQRETHLEQSHRQFQDSLSTSTVKRTGGGRDNRSREEEETGQGGGRRRPDSPHNKGNGSVRSDLNTR